jgi:geranylgeranyl diphosphate synthase type II
VSRAAELQNYLERTRRLIDQTLERHLPAPQTEPSRLHEAIRYAVLGGGKRIRPVLACAAAQACGADPVPLLRALSAVELIHTYSLVHDDLPAIDNDELRRGRKTVHVVYGEAMAILVGDALLTEAFSWLSAPIDGVPPARQLRALAVVAAAADSRGMIGGQVADIQASATANASPPSPTPAVPLLEVVRFIHKNKTGQLITASVLLGGLLADASDEQLKALEDYGRAIGLAFQIVDDLLDQEENELTLGKTAGKDLAQGKLTYPAVVGAEQARRDAAQLLDTAVESAGMIPGSVNFLPDLARYICARRN